MKATFFLAALAAPLVLASPVRRQDSASSDLTTTTTMSATGSASSTTTMTDSSAASSTTTTTTGSSTVAAATTTSSSSSSYAATPSGSSSMTALDTIILQYALTLEHLENAFYSQSLAKYNATSFADVGFPAGLYARFTEIARDEATHVATLQSVLGANATKPCTYNFSSVTGPKSFVALSQILEGVGVSAYLGAAANISSSAYLSVAASILTVEARHAAYVAAAGNKVSGYPNAFDTPLSSFSAVYTLAAQFISSCPSDNPTLPVKQFPALTISPANATGGDTIALGFNDTANAGTQVFAAFFNGLSPVFVPIAENNTVQVPDSIYGQTYVIVSSSQTELTDATAIAGVGILTGPAQA